MARVLVYGSGAIGSLIGYLLSEINDYADEVVENVCILGRKGHIQKIKENGLKINLFDEQKTLNFRHFFLSLDELDRSKFYPDLVLVCVKTHAIPLVRQEIIDSGMLGDKLKNASFILLMNGMGNADVFNLPAKVFEGVTSNGVFFSEDGQIELKGKGKTVLESRVPKEIKEFMNARFVEKGFEIEFADDFKRQQWYKLFANAVINPITALTREKNGIALSNHLNGTVEKIIDECIVVAEKEGVDFDKDEVRNFVYTVASKTSMNTSSMLQDVLKGRKTEIDSINGYVIRLAEKHKIKAPANVALYGLVKSIEDKGF